MYNNYYVIIEEFRNNIQAVLFKLSIIYTATLSGGDVIVVVLYRTNYPCFDVSISNTIKKPLILLWYVILKMFCYLSDNMVYLYSFYA